MVNNGLFGEGRDGCRIFEREVNPRGRDSALGPKGVEGPNNKLLIKKLPGNYFYICAKQFEWIMNGFRETAKVGVNIKSIHFLRIHPLRN